MYIMAVIIASLKASCCSRLGNTKIRKNRDEPKVMYRSRWCPTIFQRVVHGRHLDAAVRKLCLDEAEDILVQHANVEVDIVADDRASTDKAEKLRKDLVHRPPTATSRALSRWTLIDVEVGSLSGRMTALKGVLVMMRLAADDQRRDGDHLIGSSD